MKNVLCGVVISMGAASLLSFTAPLAKAGCGEELLQKSTYKSVGPQASGFTLIAVTTPSIVGMWDVKFKSKGKMVDFGYSVWNSDGTEFLNSGGRAPVTQNFCLGVWKRVKFDTYSLNHLALSYDTSGILSARVRIREDVKLSADGNSYVGPFSIDAFDAATGKMLLQHTGGTITGKRVTLTTSTEVD